MWLYIGGAAIAIGVVCNWNFFTKKWSQVKRLYNLATHLQVEHSSEFRVSEHFGVGAIINSLRPGKKQYIIVPYDSDQAPTMR